MASSIHLSRRPSIQPERALVSSTRRIGRCSALTATPVSVASIGLAQPGKWTQDTKVHGNGQPC
jgi:hypothetical protein